MFSAYSFVIIDYFMNKFYFVVFLFSCGYMNTKEKESNLSDIYLKDSSGFVVETTFLKDKSDSGSNKLLESVTNLDSINEVEIKSKLSAESDQDTGLIEDYIIISIIKHYSDGKSKLEIVKEDSSLFVNWYNIPTKEDDYDGLNLVIEVPRKKKKYIYGDIGSDRVEDLVVDISSSTGGTQEDYNIFIFTNVDGKYVLSGATESSEICGCKTLSFPGSFHPYSINDGKVIGISYCWSEDDPHCCPSLQYNTIAEYDGKNLRFKSKKKIQ